MVLLIDGHVQSSDGAKRQTLIQSLCANETVVAEAQRFKALPTVQIKDGSSVLYVCQGEMAIISPADIANHQNLPRVLASDDATSCCILVLSSEYYHAIAHLDCQQRTKSFFKEIAKLKKPNGQSPIKLHVVGGFRDRHGIADQLLMEIFNQVAFKSSEVYELGVCCIGDLNLKEPSSDDKQSTGPAILGISFDCLSGSLNPSSIDWSARNPLAILRLSRLHSNDDGQSIISVFDFEQRCLTITPFSYTPFSLVRSPIISYEQLRSHSTTPDHEPITFFEGSAAVNRLLFYYPNPLKSWFKDGPLKFVLSNGSEIGPTWTPVDEQSALVSDHSIFALPLSK